MSEEQVAPADRICNAGEDVAVPNGSMAAATDRLEAGSHDAACDANDVGSWCLHVEVAIAIATVGSDVGSLICSSSASSTGTKMRSRAMNLVSAPSGAHVTSLFSAGWPLTSAPARQAVEQPHRPRRAGADQPQPLPVVGADRGGRIAAGVRVGFAEVAVDRADQPAQPVRVRAGPPGPS